MNQDSDPHESIQEARVRYCRIMDEIRDRLGTIEYIYRDRRGIDDYFAAEFCCLQLRMIFELIAIGCLVAHGETSHKLSRQILKSYKPHEMLNALARLHPAFFPVPVSETLDAQGFLDAISPIENGALTRSELLTLHGKCGDMLHRGSFQKQEPLGPAPLEMLGTWQKKVVRLLNNHLISMHDVKHATYTRVRRTLPTETFDLTMELNNWPDFQKDIVRS